MSYSVKAPPGPFRPSGPPTQREAVEVPAFVRLDHAQLATMVSELAEKSLRPAPTALMELSARHPRDQRGKIDVYKPGRWDTSSNLIFMDTVRQVGSSVGEWEGSAAYVYFKPPADATYLIVAHFTGWDTTMHLNGPWGVQTAHTALTSNSGAVIAYWTGNQEFEFTMHCTVPNNDYGIGYIESIQVFELA